MTNFCYNLATEGSMARPKAADMGEPAERAKADLKTLDAHGVAEKLGAIRAAAKHPLETVTDVAAQTVLRWVDAYRRGGAGGLRPKPKRPRPSKLDAAQKPAVLSWMGAGETAGGEAVHWTPERLRAAIGGEFGVDLSANAIWVWLRKEGWSLKVPRPRRHAADPAGQGGFKKKLRGWRRRTRTPTCSSSTRPASAPSPPSAGAGPGRRAGARSPP
jgi:transposase